MLARSYLGLISGLALLAGAALMFVLCAVVYDVVARNLGFHPLEWMSAFSEYAMLVAPCFSAPWLVRINGHIIVDSLTRVLPLRARRVVDIVACLICIAICAILAWFCGVLTIDYAASGDLDIRSIALPKWILTGILELGLALSTIEFVLLLRRLLAGQNIERRESGSF
jgi:C4-dicarboxylate transporter, DctQ subunit